MSEELQDLPLARNLHIVRGESKKILAFGLSSWIVTAATFEAKRIATDEDSILHLTQTVIDGSGFTITDQDEAGSLVELRIDNTASSELAPGAYVYEVRITVAGEPVTTHLGSFTVLEGVI